MLVNPPTNIPIGSVIALVFLLLWSLIWKGLALWKAARDNERNWFIGMLVVGTFINLAGLVEIAYLFYFAKKKIKLDELFFWKKKPSLK